MRRVVVVVAAALVLTGCGAAEEPAPSETATPVSATPTPTPSATAAVPEPTPTATPTPAPIEPDASAFDIDSGASLQVVVNKRRPLQPPEYRPELVAVSSGQEGGELVRPELDAALAGMSQAMRAEIGEGTFVFSSYRGYERQAELYSGYVARYGQAEADTTSARPGHSEHQTGLAIDVSGTGGACRLATCFGDTAAGRWLAEHAWQHGFVVRYPQGLEHITGYEWEPWHLRYVGIEVSTAMHEEGAATLEEFFGLEPAPDYAP
ncbi:MULTISPECIES: M15 family metallopeptidase [Agrococcus]|uniref:M15 family metallopeptidase n=1 Tax=Agrococcus TaxID=46352 RepID=UPI0004CF91C8|nr:MULTISPECIES: M15 family metallopeptidase [Agrococcus]MBO1770486.1 M15 family metallopeptidase [Agrococcus sp. TF02-05]